MHSHDTQVSDAPITTSFPSCHFPNFPSWGNILRYTTPRKMSVLRDVLGSTPDLFPGEDTKTTCKASSQSNLVIMGEYCCFFFASYLTRSLLTIHCRWSIPNAKRHEKRQSKNWRAESIAITLSKSEERPHQERRPLPRFLRNTTNVKGFQLPWSKPDLKNTTTIHSSLTICTWMDTKTSQYNTWRMPTSSWSSTRPRWLKTTVRFG